MGGRGGSQEKKRKINKRQKSLCFQQTFHRFDSFLMTCRVDRKYMWRRGNGKWAFICTWPPDVCMWIGDKMKRKKLFYCRYYL